MDMFKTRKFIIGLVVFLLIFIGLGIIQSYLLFPGYSGVKLLFALFSTLSLMSCIYYLFVDGEPFHGFSLEDLVKNNKNYFLIGFAVIFIYLPFLTDSSYFYDDYWEYTGEHVQNGISSGLIMMRPFHGLLAELFWFVTPETGYIIKWFSVTLVLLYGLMLYKWVKTNSGDEKTSLLISLALTVFSPLSDHIGYSSTIALMPAMLAAGFSVISFHVGFKNRKDHSYLSILVIVLSFLCLVFSNMLYQVAPAIVFLFLAVYVYFNRQHKSSVRFVLSYLFIFAFASVFYLLFTKWLNHLYHIGEWSRGGFIEFTDIVPKITWFFTRVLPSAFDRLTASIFGRLLFQEKAYLYTFHSINLTIRILYYIFYVVFLTLGIMLLLLRKKNILDIVMLICFVPMSYYSFLVLKENGYLTYYAIPIISVILLYLIFIVFDILSMKSLKLSSEKISKYFYQIVFILVIVLAFQNNTYIRQFWVETNKEGYNYLKNTLSVQIKDKKKVHIYGVLSPGQGNIYSIFATKLALHELGYDANNFQITASDNDHLISIIQSEVWESIKTNISKEDFDFLLSHYKFDKTYSRYIYCEGNINVSDSDRLKWIYIKSGLLPESLNEVALVDLTWIKAYWQE